MRLREQTTKDIILKLPLKVRLLGIFLIILGILNPIILYFLNNSQILLKIGSTLHFIVFSLSLTCFLILIFIQTVYLFYFFRIHNVNTSYGHVVLLILNVISFFGSINSIFLFLPIFITGFYLLTHFKTLQVSKNEEMIHYSERFFVLFYTYKSIPFSEINHIQLEYKTGLKFLSKSKELHKFYIKLFLFEKDPGYENIPINIEEEQDSFEFFRPQTLRQTLILRPFLIDSSYFNFKDHEFMKLDQLINKLLVMMGYTKSEELKIDRKTTIIYKN